MLHNADYIYDNILKEDGINTTLNFCKKAQVGVDLSIKKVYKFITAGKVYINGTVTPDYDELSTIPGDNEGEECWYLKSGTYIVELNEGCTFGPRDTGFIKMRSSLNRSGVSVHAAVWDPGYTSIDEDGKVHPMSVRLTIENPYGFTIYKNARIAQLLVASNDDASLYAGQFQGGRLTSD